MFKDTLREMNLYVNGKGYAGVIDELNLPKLKIKTEEYRGGGMNMPVDIDMGMEKLETDFSVSKFDKNVLTSFGLKAGHAIPLTVRGAVIDEADGSEFAVVVTLRGIVTEMDFGSWKSGDNTPLKVAMSLRYYRLTVNGEDLHEIDVANMVRKINGVDQLADTRKHIGL
ncbi:phage major tail tube protein [Veronia pacifica]|uniref:Phage major tail tube protein n=1 Tax=Veronia pacifica TaxID=1080227 RepID=A0A1C3ELB1_9GAMM|nr:phage major tail tube protein [Veronia pacifica]ODA34026.1 phage major tail tube protein [Veronia pacifica]